MESKIIITINAFGITHTAVLSDECSADELIETFSNLAESIGFSPTLVIEALENAKNSRI